MNFEGKSVAITGVSSGLGFTLEAEFYGVGATMFGCDINDETVQRNIESIGATYVHADVSKEVEIESLIRGVVRNTGKIDVIINDAAISVNEELVNTNAEYLDRILAVNLKGPFYGTKHAVRAMIETGGGSIINIASILGIVADGMLAAYRTVRGGVLGLTRAAAVQYSDRGFRVNEICPGDIDTPLVREYFDLFDDPIEARAKIEMEYPMNRIAAPKEIAQTALFVASSLSSFITGQSIVVDGGLTVTCY